MSSILGHPMRKMASFMGFDCPLKKSMLFLMNFAWKSRLRIPIIILVGFLVFDVRMQLEINVDVELRQLQENADSDSEDSETDTGSMADSDESYGTEESEEDM